MNKERMFLLADLLDKLKPFRFSMSDWFSTYEGYTYEHEDIDTDSYGDIPEEHSNLEFRTKRTQVMNGYDCNSAACIAGWTVVLKHDFALERPEEDTILDVWRDDLSHMPILIEACEYLGLTRHEGLDLFTKADNSVWDRNAENLGLTETENYENYGYVDLDDVTPKVAAKLIRMVANGEVVLNEW